jgi:hypothetical protein
MPEQERFVRKQGRSKDRSRRKDGGSNYEQALIDYLQERIRPGLNRGAIPLLARSIAKDLANGGSEERLARYLQKRIKPGLNRGATPVLARSIAHDLLSGSANGGPQHDGEDDGDGRENGKGKDRGDDAAMDFETEMHDLQAELGEDWLLRFSVFNGDAWLTAEKADGSQHVEATTASVLVKAARLLDRRGGRSSS